jgi:hypothetical protein
MLCEERTAKKIRRNKKKKQNILNWTSEALLQYDAWKMMG